MLGKIEYAKYIPQLKTHSKQKELERVWDLITKDPEWVVAPRKIIQCWLILFNVSIFDVSIISVFILPLLFIIFVLKINNVLIIFPDRLNVETFLTHR